MSLYTCQHCNVTSATRELFPHSEHVCKHCMRDRPIAWKTMIYILARQNNNFPEELKIKPVKRAKATHVLHNLANPPAKQLMTNIKFDTVLFKEWTRKKLELQTQKGGQCAYTDACLDHMADWMAEKKTAGNLVIHETDISQCSWNDTLSPWPSPTDNTPAAVSVCAETPLVSGWQVKCHKQQRKNADLRKQNDELQLKIATLMKQNRQFQMRHETMAELVNHLTQRLINASGGEGYNGQHVSLDH